MMETEVEEQWVKPDAAMPVLRDVKKEELEVNVMVIDVNVIIAHPFLAQAIWICK